MRALSLASIALGIAAASACGSEPSASSGGAGTTASTTSSTIATGGSTSTSSTGAGGAPIDAGSDASDEPVPGPDASLTPFDATAIYFTNAENRRSIDVPAAFPAAGEYATITLHVTLACPSGGCDPWDRFGSLGVVTAKGTGGAPDTVIEVARFITPYHVGGSWDYDVTDLRPLLRGDVTMRAFIDTWVGPGSPYGDGWLFTASFEMKGGIPAKIPIANIPVWDQRNVVYGDPAKPISTSAPAASIPLPTASSFALRTFVTGHGQGNLGNCAEFCQRDHTITVGATPHVQKIWRSDCATTAVPGQQGTWKFSRAGWCPGADVKPWSFDVTADLAGASTASIAYDVEAYVNTCRPDAAPCAGCTLGASCAYDGGTHTEPYYALSTLLIAYR